ncbi:hypothetical protein AHAS_Ahas04G0149400 [Arachis hypogaea]
MDSASASMSKVPVITGRIARILPLDDFSLMVVASARLCDFFHCSYEVYNNKYCSLSSSIMVTLPLHFSFSSMSFPFLEFSGIRFNFDTLKLQL